MLLLHVMVKNRLHLAASPTTYALPSVKVQKRCWAARATSYGMPKQVPLSYSKPTSLYRDVQSVRILPARPDLNRGEDSED